MKKRFVLIVLSVSAVCCGGVVSTTSSSALSTPGSTQAAVAPSSKLPTNAVPEGELVVGTVMCDMQGETALSTLVVASVPRDATPPWTNVPTDRIIDVRRPEWPETGPFGQQSLRARGYIGEWDGVSWFRTGAC